MKIKKNKHKFHDKAQKKDKKEDNKGQNLENIYGGQGHPAPETRPVTSLGIEDRFAKRKGEYGKKHHQHF